MDLLEKCACVLMKTQQSALTWCVLLRNSNVIIASVFLFVLYLEGRTVKQGYLRNVPCANRSLIDSLGIDPTCSSLSEANLQPEHSLNSFEPCEVPFFLF